MSRGNISLDEMQSRITRGPFHRWLGLRVLALGEDAIEVRATWREEWVANPERNHTHGGILAALVDLAADWALTSRVGRAVPTLDMRVDYHRVALPGDLTARGRVVELGRRLAVCEAQVLNMESQMVASGRGVYYVASKE